MCSTTSARWSRRPVTARVAGRVRRLLHVVELALEIRRERRMLLRLDERALRDMGLDRGQVHAEAHRPFWSLPVDRMRL
jgi:uncharacterized protein YjiS (DUF1127 family)